MTHESSGKSIVECKVRGKLCEQYAVEQGNFLSSLKACHRGCHLLLSANQPLNCTTETSEGFSQQTEAALPFVPIKFGRASESMLPVF